MKRSLAPCIISRSARPGRSSASIVSRRCLPLLRRSGDDRWPRGRPRQVASGRWRHSVPRRHPAPVARRRSGLLAERLRALEEARQSLGNADPDVRVIVSTTRDVDEELAAGRLIPELRRALPKTLDLAPLRARLDDLSVLAPYILRRQAEQAGRTVPILSDRIAEAVEELPMARQPSGASKRAGLCAGGAVRDPSWRLAITC